MPTVDEMFPSQWFKAVDLDGDTLLTIERIAVEQVGPDREDRWVVFFQGQPKGLLLNKTNATVLGDLYGLSEDWVGKPIVLFQTQVEAFGGTHDVVRLRAPAGDAVADPFGNEEAAARAEAVTEPEEMPF